MPFQDPDPTLPCLPSDLEDALVDAALRGAALRQARIEELIAGYPEHRAAIESRLDQFRSETEGDSSGGETIGPYAILDVLGRGGMGTVYLAEQREPVQRQVALKVIRPGLDSREILARFEFERRALAVMDHPAIARVFAADTDASGRAYFAMEFVAGATLTEFCAAERLSLRARIELAVQVCRGVQHAHQKGILHRDLKPGNILVTETDGRPCVKIIDFGLARAVDEGGCEGSIHTLHGQLLGTPDYMSPEQAAGDTARIDTRTDVYALGAILFELVTGTRPLAGFGQRPSSPLELQRWLLDHEPPRPSTVTAESVTTIGMTETALQRSLRGDLDWIIMRAMAREPERRYDSAADLGADLTRFLADEPVHAGPPSVSYRARKFVRRHRGAVVAGMLVLLALVGGVIGTSVGMHRATQQAAAARTQQGRAEAALSSVHAISRWFITDFHTELADLPGTVRARRKLVDKALEYLGELAKRGGANPALMFDIARGYARVGAIQGGLGERDGARASYARAIAMLGGLAPVDRAVTHDLAVEVWLLRSDLEFEAGDGRAALAAIASAREDLAGVASEETRLGRGFEVDWRHGRILHREGDRAAARTKFEAAQAALEAGAMAQLSDAPDRRLTALAMVHLGLGTLASGSEFSPDAPRDPAAALVHFEKARAALRTLAGRRARSVRTQRLLVEVGAKIAAQQRRSGDRGAAIEALVANAAILDRLVEADPKSVADLQALTACLSALARNQRDDGDLDAAVATTTRSIAMRSRVRGLVPKDVFVLRRHATQYEMLAGIHKRRRDVAALRSAYADAFLLWREVEARNADHGDEIAVASARNRLIGALMELRANAPLLAELRTLEQELQARLAQAEDAELRMSWRRTRALIGSTLFGLAAEEKDDKVAVAKLKESLSLLRGELERPAVGALDPIRAQLPGMIAAVENLLAKRSR